MATTASGWPARRHGDDRIGLASATMATATCRTRTYSTARRSAAGIRVGAFTRIFTVDQKADAVLVADSNTETATVRRIADIVLD